MKDKTKSADTRAEKSPFHYPEEKVYQSDLHTLAQPDAEAYAKK